MNKLSTILLMNFLLAMKESQERQADIYRGQSKNAAAVSCDAKASAYCHVYHVIKSGTENSND